MKVFLRKMIEENQDPTTSQDVRRPETLFEELKAHIGLFKPKSYYLYMDATDILRHVRLKI
ncbi:MAG: hypothetical protein QXW39_04365 [Candidatus Bathyarchaeia archaeon]